MSNLEILFVVIVVVISLILIFIFAFSGPDLSQFGTWERDEQECIRSSSCQENGTRMVIYRCKSRNGKGCIEDNRQTFLNRIEEETCKPSCVRSKWVLSKEDNTKVICTSMDPVGSNGCTNLELREIFGPHGEESESNQLVEYQIGDVLDLTF